jgi:hypothetical protein
MIRWLEFLQRRASAAYFIILDIYTPLCPVKQGEGLNVIYDYPKFICIRLWHVELLRERGTEGN